jgi:hypothetical protein
MAWNPETLLETQTDPEMERRLQRLERFAKLVKSDATLALSMVRRFTIDGGTEVDPGSITTTSLADNAITTPKIAANAVIADKIAASAITTDKIAANAVTADKINVNQLSAISVNAGELTAGTLTGLLIRTAAAPGQRVEINSADGLRGIDASGTVQFQIRASDGKGIFGGGVATIGADNINFSTSANVKWIRQASGSAESYIAGEIGAGGAAIGMWGLRTASIGSQLFLDSSWPRSILQAFDATNNCRVEVGTTTGQIVINGSTHFLIQPAGTTDATAMLLMLNRGGVTSTDLVYLGPQNSGGTGYRVLRVPN